MSGQERTAAHPHGKDCRVCENRRELKRLAEGMEPYQASAASSRSTTSAIGPDGRTIHFDDLVSDGDLVEVEGRPMIVYYDADAPDWFVGDEEEAVRRTFARHGMA